MKGFTIKLPKQNIDPQGSLKNRILNEVKNRLPLLNGMEFTLRKIRNTVYHMQVLKTCYVLDAIEMHISLHSIKNIIDRHVHMIIHLHVRSQIEHLNCVNMMLFQNLI